MPEARSTVATANCELQTANCGRRFALNQGFSLIEVLVATALLIMIVSMIGFVFRQSSMSWDSGIRRAEGASRVRAVVGAIERDLRSAVDAREFPGLTQSFSDPKTISFAAFLEPDKNKPDQRVLAQITYQAGKEVKRTAQHYKSSGTSWTPDGSAITSTLLESDGNADISVSFSSVAAPATTGSKLPAYVTITAELVSQDAFSGLTVRSLGRDGRKGTRDDIVVE